MPPFPDPEKVGALCQGIAAGLYDSAAAVRAGFAPGSSWYKELVLRPEIQARVDHLKRCHELVRDGLAPLIFALQDVATKAATRDSDPALAVVVRALTEAGRMLERMPPPEGPPEPLPDWAPRT